MTTPHLAIALRLINFIERTPIRDAESLLDIKSVLEEQYTDGITAIREAYLEGENIGGIFEDRVSAQLTKRYRFEITEEFTSYRMLNPGEAEEFAEPVEFAAKGKANKAKNCTKGTPCGGSCISAKKTCRKTNSTKAKAKVQKVKAKTGGGGEINYKVDKSDYKQLVALGKQFAQKNLDKADPVQAANIRKLEGERRKAEKEYQKLTKEYYQIIRRGEKPSEEFNDRHDKSYRDVERASNRLEAVDGARFARLKQAIIDKHGITDTQAQQWLNSIKVSGLMNQGTESLREVYRLSGGKGADGIKEIVSEAQRAYTNTRSGFMDVGIFERKGTIFHEYGHHVESRTGAKKASGDWVRSRATSQEEKPLSELTGNPRYKEKEKAFPGKFIDPYVGKIYGDGETEVISMGIERFSSPGNMRRLRQQDEEHFNLALGLLVAD